jgi:hypothetical protein
MARVALLTRWATYQGILDLSAPGGQAVRFLDALNHPHRLVEGAGKAVPSLILHQALRRDEQTGKVFQCGDVAVRPGAVVVAWEVAVEQRVGGPGMSTAYEARRSSQDASRVVVYLENGSRIEATISGSLSTLDPNKLGRDFVACRDAVIHDPRREEPREQPFVAVNVRQLEATGELDAAARPAAAAPGATTRG